MEALEQSVVSIGHKSLILVLLLTFAVSCPLSALEYFPLSFGLMPMLSSSSYWAIWSFVAPLTQWFLRILGMSLVAFFVWKVVPNRRYGAVLGAVMGLGYGLFYMTYRGLTQGYPLTTYSMMIPVEDFFITINSGIGVFALVARKNKNMGLVQSLFGLPLLFFFIDMVLAMFHGAVGPNLAGGWYPIKYAMFPVYAFILRDFLGGHFNFQNFFESLPEPSPDFLEAPPPPPPPP